MTNPTSSYVRIADLPLKVERHRLVGRESDTGQRTRQTTIIELDGRGESGQGEDITYQSSEHEEFQKAGHEFDFAGSYTLDEFSGVLDRQPLFSEVPESSRARLHRRWAFESAAPRGPALV